MNFLAHAYLSGDNEEILVGNFIADSLRGNSFPFFTPDMIRGVQLHRHIDKYTDAHPIVQESKRRLRLRFSKYAPVIVDIFYDHYLAKDWSSYAEVPLSAYSSYVYGLIERYEARLPEQVQHFFPYMKRNDWLSSYAEISGLQRIFNGMARRASFVSLMEEAPEALLEHYEQYHSEFQLFFDDLRSECKLWLAR